MNLQPLSGDVHRTAQTRASAPWLIAAGVLLVLTAVVAVTSRPSPGPSLAPESRAQPALAPAGGQIVGPMATAPAVDPRIPRTGASKATKNSTLGQDHSCSGGKECDADNPAVNAAP